jgi:hypothetical protein
MDKVVQKNNVTIYTYFISVDLTYFKWHFMLIIFFFEVSIYIQLFRKFNFRFFRSLNLVIPKG